VDAFDVLGLPAEFAVDAAAVNRAYLARSAALHPDLAAGDESAPRKMAELNEAKRVVEDPERRANALLARLGGPSKEEDRSLPDGFLMEMMEVREQMEAEGTAERGKWEAWAKERRREAIEDVGAMFRAAADEGMLGAIRRRLNAWRYIERMVEQIGE
jgi:molecular chaperone HscB